MISKWIKARLLIQYEEQHKIIRRELANYSKTKNEFLKRNIVHRHVWSVGCVFSTCNNLSFVYNMDVFILELMSNSVVLLYQRIVNAIYSGSKIPKVVELFENQLVPSSEIIWIMMLFIVSIVTELFQLWKLIEDHI